MDGTKLDNLDQLIALIPQLIKKKYFTIDYINLLPLGDSMSELFGERFSQQDYLKADVAYDKNTPEPKIFTFNKEKMEWESERIGDR